MVIWFLLLTNLPTHQSVFYNMISKAKAWPVSLTTACRVYKCLECQITLYNLYVSAVLPQWKNGSVSAQRRGERVASRRTVFINTAKGSVWFRCEHQHLMIINTEGPFWGLYSVCLCACINSSGHLSYSHITIPHSVSALHSCSPAEWALLRAQLVCVSCKLWRSRSLPSCDSLSILKRGMEGNSCKSVLLPLCLVLSNSPQMSSVVEAG